MTVRICGTKGYAEEAEELFKRYESVSFADAHRPVLHLIPQTAASVLDIGSGTGRDAAALAAMGHRVLAVEPTDALRTRAMVLHRSPRIEWLNDSLPDLALIKAREERFDLVMLTAVWMHLDEGQRRQGMPVLASLVREGGVMMMSLRHGSVPHGRRMFEVSGEETIELAREHCLEPILNLAHPSIQWQNRLAGVTWTRLAFKKEGEDPG